MTISNGKRRQIGQSSMKQGIKHMRNKRWKEFQKRTGECYLNLAETKKDISCWNRAFDILKEIVAEERDHEPGYGTELYLLDEGTDYQYDVQGWLEDYLDEVDMQEEYGKLVEVCDELLGMFRWEEWRPSDIKFRKASALGALGKNEAASAFCKKWLAEEPDNIWAVTAGVYADIALRDMEAAGRLIGQYIQEETICTEENDILFAAASVYYQITGDQEKKQKIDWKLEAYDELVGEYLRGGGEEDVLVF